MIKKISLILSLLSISLAADAEEIIDEVIVTGTFIKQTEQRLYSLDVINEDDYRNLNISNVAEISKYISSSLGSHFQTNSLDGFDQGMASINLRGLGSSSTLILVNSKRHTFAGTPSSSGDSYIDLNIIPEIAINNIDILKEGATSIYGSDAVSGVVNISTNNDFEGLKIRFEHHGTENYNQTDTSISALMGANFEKLNYSIGLNILDRNPLSASEINGIAELAISGLGRSFKVHDDDVVINGPWAGEYTKGEKIPDPNCLNNGGVLTNSTTCGFKYGERFNIVNSENHKKVFLNIGYTADTFDYKAVLLLSNVKVNDNPQSPSYPALPFLSRKIQPNQGGSPFNVPVTWYGRPLGSEYDSPKSPKDISQYNFNQTVAKEIGRGIQLEASLTLSNHSNEHYRPDIIDSKFLQALNGVTIQDNQDIEVFWDIFNPENNSNELIDYISGAEISKKTANLKSFDLIFRRAIKNNQLAYGIYADNEELKINYDEISEARFSNSGQILKTADLFFLGGGINVNESRNRYAAFAELDTKSRNLNGKISGRYERFNSASSFDPKISLHYEVNNNLSLRASRGSSFSMPSMAQTYSSEIILGSVRDFDGASSFVRQAKLGNVNLKPATSLNTNFGLIYVNRNHKVTIDLWNIDFKNRIESESAQAILNLNPFGDNITRNENNDIVGVTSTYFNEENTQISGVDFKYELLKINTKNLGLVSAKVESTTLYKFLTPDAADPAQLVNRVGRFNYDTHTYSLPKTKINASLLINKNEYKYQINARYLDGYKNYRTISDLGQSLGYKNIVDSFLIFDFSVGSYIEFRGGKIDFKLSIANVLDQSAPRVFDAPDFSFDTRAHDPRGRIIGLTFEYLR
jgi:iron complex outermembrane receptor protein